MFRPFRRSKIEERDLDFSLMEVEVKSLTFAEIVVDEYHKNLREDEEAEVSKMKIVLRDLEFPEEAIELIDSHPYPVADGIVLQNWEANDRNHVDACITCPMCGKYAGSEWVSSVEDLGSWLVRPLAEVVAEVFLDHCCSEEVR